MQTNDPYQVYVQAYGMVSPGAVLKTNDFGVQSMKGFRPFGNEGSIAVSLAAQDVKTKQPMRSKPEFEEELQRLLGKPT